MDMIQHLTELRITSLCADLETFHKTRKSVAVNTDDFGAVLLRLGDHARGSFAVSQMSAGCKNRLQFEIYGTKCGVAWNQERPDELWIGRRNAPNQILLKDPALLEARAVTFADLPGGHSEGYDDTHKQMFRRFYARVADRTAPVEYPTFADGASGMELLEKILESSRKRAWVEC
jgi:predicted dehydrogenase